MASHVYDLGSFNFNCGINLDLLEYHQRPIRCLSYVFGGNREIKYQEPKSFNFKSARRSTAPEFYLPSIPMETVPVPYRNPQMATEGFVKGFKVTINEVNKYLCKFDRNFKINLDNFEITEFAKLQSISGHLYIPVEMMQLIELDGKQFTICINFDNPTSLQIGNQSSGCQGSHFGFTLISNQQKVRGHILVTTFIGFPSRDKNYKWAILNEMESHERIINMTALYNLTKWNLPFDITTESGITNNQYHHRTSFLPDNLKPLQNTFPLNDFRLPDINDSNFLSKFCS